MVSSDSGSPVSGVRLSTMVPAKISGENREFQLTDTDLATKLHYIKGVYFFNSDAVQGLSVNSFKKALSQLLEICYMAAGRIRRSETGRPFIKCNDGGVRVVEASCDKTVDEWLEIKDDSRDSVLVYDQVLGPDLGFSPLVYFQFTWFKCGGMSLGLSWAHILGDPFSASAFANTWAQVSAGHVPSKSLHVLNTSVEFATPDSTPLKPCPYERVESVGDHWQIPNNSKMKMLSFHFTPKQLDHLLSSTHSSNPSATISHFEVLSAIIWKSLSKVREDPKARIVTICHYNSEYRENFFPANDISLSIIDGNTDILKQDVSELATLIAERNMCRDHVADEITNKEGKNRDFIMYGANLTFVNMEKASIYDLKLSGVKPKFASYNIDGVGDQGVVLVHLGQEDEGQFGRIVNVVLPERQVASLKYELKENWGIN